MQTPKPDSKAPQPFEEISKAFDALPDWTKALFLATYRIEAIRFLSAHPEVPPDLLKDATKATLNTLRYSIAAHLITSIATKSEELCKESPQFTPGSALSLTFALTAEKLLADVDAVFARSNLLLKHLAETYPHLILHPNKEEPTI